MSKSREELIESVLGAKELEDKFQGRIDALKAALEKSPGLKFDNGKPPMELLSTHFLLEVSKVLEFGAKKYAVHNWRQGIQISRLVGAAMRHITAFNAGEDVDPETGLSHIGHAGCCLMFISELMITHPELDDRYKVPAQQEFNFPIEPT